MSYKLGGVVWNDDGIMKQELTPLQALDLIVADLDSVELEKEIDIIETALKELEKPKEIVGTTPVDKALEQFLIDSCPEVAKKLKTLKIIRIVCPNIFWVMRTYTYEEYKKKCSDDTLLQEEYELLKEVFLNDR